MKGNSAKVFLEYSKTNQFRWSYITKQTTFNYLLRSLGKNLDILTDLIYIFNNTNSFLNIFQNIVAGSPFISHIYYIGNNF